MDSPVDTKDSTAAPTADLQSPPPGIVARTRLFLQAGIWQPPPPDQSRVRQIARTLLRMTLIVARDFGRNRCALQASGLTYVTLMSMVPVLALMFSMAKGFGAHDNLIEALRDRLQDLPPQTSEFIETLFPYVDKTNFATVGAIGLLVLFWSVISMMSNIESAFNDIWRVNTPRTLIRRFQCYISILVFVPILFLAATSTTAMLSSRHLHQWLATQLGPLYALVQTGLQFTGLLSFAVAFGLLYLFMPNTRVRVGSALAGGVVAGIAWYTWQIVCVWIQVGASQQNAVYGTFAAVPLFLAWMYASWMIVLVGAEVSFAFQQRHSLDRAFDAIPLSCHERILLGLLIVHDVCAAACRGHGPWTARGFTRRHRLSDELVLEIAKALVRNGLLVEVAGQADSFVPAKDMRLLSPADVEQVFRHEVPTGPRVVTMAGNSVVEKLFAAKFKTYTNALREQSFAELIGDGVTGAAP